MMRFVPQFLQPLLVWLTPYKWRLERSWKTLEELLAREIEKHGQDQATMRQKPDVISGLLAGAKSKEETEVHLLSRLLGSIIAGGTYSTAAFVTGVIFDLVTHPAFLVEIREEIQATHKRVEGNWDIAAFNSLEKLDSAMKETSRLAPGSLIVYTRHVEEPTSLSNGLHLQPGQLISTSGHSLAMDPTKFTDPQKYDALRAYKENLQTHRSQPFQSVDGRNHRWGAGRWACPGRVIASLTSKVALVKLLGEYDFAFDAGLDGVAKVPQAKMLHEFVYIDPDAKMVVRKREKNLGILY
jgi:cytochrome P450